MMQIFDDYVKPKENWQVGDVIRYGAYTNENPYYAKIVSFNINNVYRHCYSTVLLNKDNSDGQLSRNGKLDSESFADFVEDISDLRKNYFRKWDYAEIVPFYGTVGEPMKDQYGFPTKSDFRVTIETTGHGFKHLTPKEQQKEITRLDSILKGLKVIAKHEES